MRCGKFYGLDFIMKGEGVPKCECGGIVKPDVVLYEEPLDYGVTEEQLRRIMKEEGVRQEDVFLLTVNKLGAVNLIEREKDL